MTTNRTMLQNLGNDNKGGGKKEENGGKRSPIFRRKIKLAAKDDKTDDNKHDNKDEKKEDYKKAIDNKEDDSDDEVIPGSPKKTKPVRLVRKKYTDYSNVAWCTCSDDAQDLNCKYHLQLSS